MNFDEYDSPRPPSPALGLLLLVGAGVGAAAAWLLKTEPGQRLREEAAAKIAQGREWIVQNVESETPPSGGVKER